MSLPNKNVTYKINQIIGKLLGTYFRAHGLYYIIQINLISKEGHLKSLKNLNENYDSQTYKDQTNTKAVILEVYMNVHTFTYVYLHKHTYIYQHRYIDTELSIYTYCEQHVEERICSCKFTYLILYTEKYIWGTK
jgi:hypothetical protein